MKDNTEHRWVHGDIEAYISFCIDGDGYTESGDDSLQPAMVIRRRNGPKDAPKWVVPLDSAWMYCNPDGYPTTYAFQKTSHIGDFIGVGNTIHSRRQIWEAISDCMSELLHAPEYDMIKESHGIIEKPSIGEIALFTEGELTGVSEMKP